MTYLFRITALISAEYWIYKGVWPVWFVPDYQTVKEEPNTYSSIWLKGV